MIKLRWILLATVASCNMLIHCQNAKLKLSLIEYSVLFLLVRNYSHIPWSVYFQINVKGTHTYTHTHKATIYNGENKLASDNDNAISANKKCSWKSNIHTLFWLLLSFPLSSLVVRHVVKYFTLFIVII